VVQNRPVKRARKIR